MKKRTNSIILRSMLGLCEIQVSKLHATLGKYFFYIAQLMLGRTSMSLKSKFRPSYLGLSNSQNLISMASKKINEQRGFCSHKFMLLMFHANLACTMYHTHDHTRFTMFHPHIHCPPCSLSFVLILYTCYRLHYYYFIF